MPEYVIYVGFSVLAMLGGWNLKKTVKLGEDVAFIKGKLTGLKGCETDADRDISGKAAP